MRDKYRRKVFTKIVFLHPVESHTIDIHGYFQRISILRNELLYYRARFQKQLKGKMVLNNIFKNVQRKKFKERG